MDQLVKEVLELVRQSRHRVAITVNAELTLLYWQIGQQIRKSVLHDTRGEYGKKVIETLSTNLTTEFGKGWSQRHLWNCTKFYDVFPDVEILHTLCTELTWSHFRLLCGEENPNKRFFYALKAQTERWSVRELDEQIDKMLYERTALAAKPEEQIQTQLIQLHQSDSLSPDLVFKNTYVLDFLGLSGAYSEADLEIQRAIANAR